MSGECHRQQGGQIAVRQGDDSHRAVSDRAGAASWSCRPGGDALPEPYLTAVLEVLNEQAQGGGSLGFPLMKVKITVLGGEVHETESNEIAFRYRRGRRLQQGPARGRASCCWSRS